MNGVESAYTAVEGQLVGPMQNAYSWLTACFPVIVLDANTRYKHKGISTRYLKQNTHSCKYTNAHQLSLQHPTLQPNWDPLKIIILKNQRPLLQAHFWRIFFTEHMSRMRLQEHVEMPAEFISKKPFCSGSTVGPQHDFVRDFGDGGTGDTRLKKSRFCYLRQREVDWAVDAETKKTPPKIGWTELQSAINNLCF